MGTQSKKIKILLDIDDTSLISKDKGKTYNEHPMLKSLIENYDVYLFSGNPDIEKYFIQWKTKGMIPKGSNYIPTADVFIDNDYELWADLVIAKKFYRTIEEFLNNQK